MSCLSKLVPRKSFAKFFCMQRKGFLFAFLFFLIFSNLYTNLAHAGSNGIEINLGVEGCDNNGLCQGAENILSCPSDCTPVVPPPPGAPVAYPDGVNLYNMSVVASFTTATISWESSVGTISTVKWGQTTEVKEGVLTGILFAINHKVEIVNLKPGTMYYFTIESKTITGKISTNPPVLFFTKFLIDTAFPLAPRNVKATAGFSGVNITWQNPPDDNFSYVRIMRHEDRFRGDPFQGKMVYEGTAEKFLDKNVTAGKKYFYVLFARNKKGDFSTGVGVSATAFSPVALPPEETPPEKIPPQTKPASPAPTQKDLETSYKNFIERPKTPVIIFFVHQYNEEVEPLSSENIISINRNRSTVVDTNTKTLPDDWLVVTDSSGVTVGEFLFAYNKDSDRYQSVIPPLERDGNYDIKIYRYDGDTPIKIGEGKLLADRISGSETEGSETITSRVSYSLWAILLFLVIFLILFLKRRHRRE